MLAKHYKQPFRFFRKSTEDLMVEYLRGDIGKSQSLEEQEGSPAFQHLRSRCGLVAAAA
jgi:hypothetical protein